MHHHHEMQMATTAVPVEHAAHHMGHEGMDMNHSMSMSMSVRDFKNNQ